MYEAVAEVRTRSKRVRDTLLSMIAALRQDFNRRYTHDKYQALLREANLVTRTELSIRVAETPVFLPGSLVQQMVEAGAAMTHQLVNDREYLREAAANIPAKFRVAHQDTHPNFMTVDFGLVHTGEGPWKGDPATLSPRLVELQAFPSVYGYQSELSKLYRRHFEMDAVLESYLGGLDETDYWEAMRETIVGEHAPENVVLLEVTPEQQKTVPDFHIHEDRLGIRMVDICAVRQRGRKLFYDRDGVETPITRIYNRAIADEMIRKNITPGFDMADDFDVEWAGNPNWYFLISKYSLPYLRHPFAPPAVFLDEWMRGEGRDRLSANRNDWVLKPLFSFAGKGIEFAPSDDLLAKIPADERRGYLLQQRMQFEPTVSTPCGMTQAEIRIMYLWPQGGSLQPVNTLVRLGRGKMMGVDHNKNQDWVGGSAGLVLP